MTDDPFTAADVAAMVTDAVDEALRSYGAHDRTIVAADQVVNTLLEIRRLVGMFEEVAE